MKINHNVIMDLGGEIFVFTGLLAVTENEDGLAAVIGHEAYSGMYA